MTDTIKRYSKKKGYESLPRELLQDQNISLQAIGLLCNIASYPDTWVLRKTELRKRFNKHGSSAIDRYWDELVENNYIIQFRKRNGKTYEYRYFYSLERFSTQEVQELLVSMLEDRFMLYHKDMIKNGYEDLSRYLYCKNKDKLDLSFWSYENQKSKEHDKNKDCSSSENGKSNMESPKAEVSKLTSQEINYKDYDEDDYIKLGIEKEKFEMFSWVIGNHQGLNDAAKYLYGSGTSLENVIEIVLGLQYREDLIIPELIVKQHEWCVIKGKTGVIGNYAKYFIGGLDRQKAYITGKIDDSEREKYYEKSIDFELKSVKIPIYKLG